MLTSIAGRAARHNPRIPQGLSAVPAPSKTPPSLARLYARPGFLLRRAHQISAAVFEDACKRPRADAGAVRRADGAAGASRDSGQSSLARALGFDKVTVLRVLRGLEVARAGRAQPGAGQPPQRVASR